MLVYYNTIYHNDLNSSPYSSFIFNGLRSKHIRSMHKVPSWLKILQCKYSLCKSAHKMSTNSFKQRSWLILAWPMWPIRILISSTKSWLGERWDQAGWERMEWWLSEVEGGGTTVCIHEKERAPRTRVVRGCTFASSLNLTAAEQSVVYEVGKASV